MKKEISKKEKKFGNNKQSKSKDKQQSSNSEKSNVSLLDIDLDDMMMGLKGIPTKKEKRGKARKRKDKIQGGSGSDEQIKS